MPFIVVRGIFNDMKMMVVYGSPRQSGSSAFLGKEFIDEVRRLEPDAQIHEAMLQKLNIHGCMGCDACRRNGGHCIQEDDMQDLYKLYEQSDTIVLLSPVYWWGVTAQMKLFIDRLYKFGASVHPGKKWYVIVNGEDGLQGIQYELIRQQFVEICEYCKINFVGYLPISTPSTHPAKSNKEASIAVRSLYKGN